MDCSCTDEKDMSIEIAYQNLKNDLEFFHINKKYEDFFERLEKEFPIELANISKLKVIK